MLPRLRQMTVQVGYRFFGNRYDAEDVAQDALLRLWTYCEQLDAGRNMEALAIMVAKNICVEKYKRKQIGIAEATQEIEADDAYAADGGIRAQETQMQIETAIKSLSPRQQQLVKCCRDGHTEAICEKYAVRSKVETDKDTQEAMKQHKNNRDEQLYQQILAELKPGADEYDRIMAQGKQPARRRFAACRYAAAACLLVAVAGLSVYLQKNVPAESPAPAVAEMEVTHQTEKPQVSEPSPSPKEAIAEAPRAKRAAQRQPTVLPAQATPQTSVSEEDSVPKAAPQEADDSDQELILGILAQVEAQAIHEERGEEMLYQTILNEISDKIINTHTQSELSL